MVSDQRVYGNPWDVPAQLIKLLEAHESEGLCLEYSAVDNGKCSENTH